VVGLLPSQRVDLVVCLLFVPPSVEVVVDMRASTDIAVRGVVIHLLTSEHRRDPPRYHCMPDELRGKEDLEESRRVYGIVRRSPNAVRSQHPK
jgi:hypothetical protein